MTRRVSLSGVRQAVLLLASADQQQVLLTIKHIGPMGTCNAVPDIRKPCDVNMYITGRISEWSKCC